MKIYLEISGNKKAVKNLLTEIKTIREELTDECSNKDLLIKEIRPTANTTPRMGEIL